MAAFSVIIPTRNRPKQLANCLECFTQLNYPTGRWELIVVNDGGEESFTAVSDQIRHQLPLTLLSIPASGPAAARNAGAKTAQYSYLAFTDDDCRVTPDWLRQFERGFGDTGWDAIGGQTLNPQKRQAGMQAAQFLIDFLYGFMRDAQENALLLVSNNAAFDRAVFETVGGFDESFYLAAAEDLELSHRLTRMGFRTGYYPAAQVWHHHQLSAWGHVRQQFRYGRGGYYFYKDQKLSGATRQGGTAVQFYSTLARHLWRSALSWRARGVVAGAQVAYRLGIFYERFRHWRDGRHPSRQLTK